MEIPQLKIEKTIIHAPCEKSFKILHITDTHICRAYDYEGAGKVALAAERGELCFGGEKKTEKYFEDAIEYGKKNGCVFAFTGDLYDFLTDANFDYIGGKIDGLDYVYAAGNHDFCTAPGADKEDTKFKRSQWPKVAPHFRSNIMMDSRVVNGVNLVTIDDSYNQFNEAQLLFLKAEAAKGLPMILFMHNPLYTPMHAAAMMSVAGVAFQVNPPEELLARYPKVRADYQRATPITRKVTQYIINEPAIKAVFAGHTHMDFEESLPSGTPMITTNGTFRGIVREITVCE